MCEHNANFRLTFFALLIACLNIVSRFKKINNFKKGVDKLNFVAYDNCNLKNKTIEKEEYCYLPISRERRQAGNPQ